MYNYREAVLEDTIEAIEGYISFNGLKKEEIDRAEFEEKMNEELWTEDCVTGNGSGSYTFNTKEAEENLGGNWDLAAEAMEAFDCKDVNPMEKGAEWVDVTIRCYLLSESITKALDKILA